MEIMALEREKWLNGRWIHRQMVCTVWAVSRFSEVATDLLCSLKHIGLAFLNCRATYNSSLCPWKLWVLSTSENLAHAVTNWAPRMTICFWKCSPRVVRSSYQCKIRLICALIWGDEGSDVMLLTGGTVLFLACKISVYFIQIKVPGQKLTFKTRYMSHYVSGFVYMKNKHTAVKWIK